MTIQNGVVKISSATSVQIDFIVISTTRKKAAYRPLWSRPCGQLVGLRPTCSILEHDINMIPR